MKVPGATPQMRSKFVFNKSEFEYYRIWLGNDRFSSYFLYFN